MLKAAYQFEKLRPFIDDHKNWFNEEDLPGSIIYFIDNVHHIMGRALAFDVYEVILKNTSGWQGELITARIRQFYNNTVPTNKDIIKQRICLDKKIKIELIDLNRRQNILNRKIMIQCTGSCDYTIDEYFDYLVNL